jgi:hypothetical protein
MSKRYYVVLLASVGMCTLNMCSTVMPKLSLEQRIFLLRTCKYEQVATVLSFWEEHCEELPPSFLFYHL